MGAKCEPRFPLMQALPMAGMPQSAVCFFPAMIQCMRKLSGVYEHSPSGDAISVAAFSHS